MDAARFDLLTRSVSTISRRGGLLAGASAVLGARLGSFGLEEAGAKQKRKKRKKKVRCAAGELRCGRKKCCGPGFICRNSDKAIKGKGPIKICSSVCGADGSQCGTAVCGNGGPGSNCATTFTAEGEEFCLDFAKANPIGCGAICRTSEDCGPDGVCLCVDNAPLCSCGEGVPTTCFARADVECA
jgi:hypothetical protein